MERNEETQRYGSPNVNIISSINYVIDEILKLRVESEGRNVDAEFASYCQIFEMKITGCEFSCVFTFLRLYDVDVSEI